MTNAQKWVAAFLTLFILLFLLQSITKKEVDEYDDFEFYGDNNEPVELTGKQLFENNGCINCHGSDLQGTTSGPSLVLSNEYWNRTELINYLRNPSSYGNTERITGYKVKFSKVTMPAFENIDVKDLGKITDYVLSAH